MLKSLFSACVLLWAFSVGAEARSRHHYRQPAATACSNPDVMRPCLPSFDAGFLAGVRSIRVTMHRERHAGVAPQVIGGRPAGCPARFCGCGASLHLFGRIVPRLNLAANWLRFPRTTPAPKMAASRPGHVFVLEAHIEGNVWLVYDANSGGHRTRLHARSIAGYTIVNPHGAG